MRDWAGELRVLSNFMPIKLPIEHLGELATRETSLEAFPNGERD